MELTLWPVCLVVIDKQHGPPKGSSEHPCDYALPKQRILNIPEDSEFYDKEVHGSHRAENASDFLS